MSIATPPPTSLGPSANSPWPLHKFTVAEYQRFVTIGAFGEDDAVELLEGWVAEKMPKNPLHDGMIDVILAVLMRVLPAGWYVRVQNSLVTSDSVPEPDLAVVSGSGRDYLQRHPTADDTILVVEVADTSVTRDREKRRIYARASVPLYWIVNLDGGCIEAFADPDPDNSEYRNSIVFHSGETLEITFPNVGSLPISVAELLPPNELH